MMIPIVRFLYFFALGHGDLLSRAIAADGLQQVVLGQDLGELQHRQGHGVDVVGQRQGDIVGQVGRVLQVFGHGFADGHFHVAGESTEDVLGQLALRRRHLRVLDFVARSELPGGLAAGLARGVRHQLGDVVFRERDLLLFHGPLTSGQKCARRKAGKASRAAGSTLGLWARLLNPCLTRPFRR